VEKEYLPHLRICYCEEICAGLGQVTFQGKQTQLGARSFDGKNLAFCCPGFSPAHNYALEHGIRVQVTDWD